MTSDLSRFRGIRKIGTASSRCCSRVVSVFVQLFVFGKLLVFKGGREMVPEKTRKRTFRTFLRLLFLGERIDFNPHPPAKSWRWWYPSANKMDGGEQKSGR